MARLRAAALAAAALVAAVALLAGCSSPSGTATPRPTTAPTSGASGVPPSIDVEQPGLTPSTGQRDTEWGPIWETVPPGFPVAPGAQDAEADDVVSAAYAVPKSSVPDARSVADFYGSAFAEAGYGGGVDGPFEDGSYSAWASNGYGCDMVVQAVPRGPAETYVTVLYGAGCPFEWPAEE